MNEMTSMERVLKTLGHKEPDRVPLMLLLSIYGARESGITPKKYFTGHKDVVKTQIHMQKKYSNDCFYTFYYAPVEIEAFGGNVVYVDDGPPNSGEPFIQNIDDIWKLQPPSIESSPSLLKVLRATEELKQHACNEIPIIGVVMSPYSLPVMQMGFEKYLELLYYRPKEFNRLMEINIEFCTHWANSQLKSGATAICYFDPLASPTVIERSKYLETGFKVASQTISAINGPTATHLASGTGLDIMDDLIKTGTEMAAISVKDDLGELKKKTKSKITLIGNLNGIDMEYWSKEETFEIVRKTIITGGKGGGFILSDNHGEIPFHVKEETLLAIGEAVARYGSYPLKENE